MNQEDYNAMQKTPEEGYLVRHPMKDWHIFCPSCGEAYLGNGRNLCVDCQALAALGEVSHE